MLFLRFSINLKNNEIEEIVRPNGVIFHRWLPYGRRNSIKLPVKDKKNHIEVWFNRRGFLSKTGFIEYDGKKNKVDKTVMEKQCKLESGPLYGQAVFSHITESELLAIKTEKKGSTEYISIAKRVIQFLYEPLNNFVNLLRYKYGQYWLPELKSWDSRKESLGSYCSTTLFLKWRDKKIDSWHKFIPTQVSGRFSIEKLPGKGFAEYLTKEDWNTIKKDFKPYQDMSLALKLLGRAHELYDSGHIRESYIQGVTALELSIGEYIKNRTGDSQYIETAFKQFNSLPIKTKILSLSLASNLLSNEELEKTIEAIDLRNAIVHEGIYPSDPGKTKFLALLKCIGVFLGLDGIKSPVLYPGNQLSDPIAKGAQLINFE